MCWFPPPGAVVGHDGGRGEIGDGECGQERDHAGGSLRTTSTDVKWTSVVVPLAVGVGTASIMWETSLVRASV
jgi:hypothetical protein